MLVQVMISYFFVKQKYFRPFEIRLILLAYHSMVATAVFQRYNAYNSQNVQTGLSIGETRDVIIEKTGPTSQISQKCTFDSKRIWAESDPSGLRSIT